MANKKIRIIALVLFMVAVGVVVAQGTINTHAVALAGFSDGQRDYSSTRGLTSFSQNRANSYANGYSNGILPYQSEAWYLVYETYRLAYQEGWFAQAERTDGTVRW